MRADQKIKVNKAVQKVPQTALTPITDHHRGHLSLVLVDPWSRSDLRSFAINSKRAALASV